MTTRGTILPSLPPLADELVIEVCSACLKRCCWLGDRRWFQCPAAIGGTATTSNLAIAKLRELALEHHSFWRANKGDDHDMPKCVEDLANLATYDRKKAIEKPEKCWTLEERARLFAGYLTEQLGLDPEQCRDAVRDIWPECSEAIEQARLELCADAMRPSKPEAS
jgi:hypothetical protein